MRGETVKLVGAQQENLFNTYKNTNLKLLKTNATIWFLQNMLRHSTTTQVHRLQDQRS
jgi:hypothetical protein